MENRNFSAISIQEQIASFINTMISVITNPVGFFRSMPKTGGLIEPLIFLAVMGGVGGGLHAVLSVFNVGFVTSFFMALAIIIIGPIVSAIFGSIVAASLFFVWKLMGSQETIETAFRCGAYATAITPLTTLFGIIPYWGTLLGLGWMAYLMVIASVEVHQIDAKKAWVVFGIIAAVLALSSISSQIAARRITSKIDQFETTIKQFDQMSPEEVGEKVGRFLKGIEKGAGKQ